MLVSKYEALNLVEFESQTASNGYIKEWEKKREMGKKQIKTSIYFYIYKVCLFMQLVLNFSIMKENSGKDILVNITQHLKHSLQKFQKNEAEIKKSKPILTLLSLTRSY